MQITIQDMWQDCDPSQMVGDRWAGEVRVVGWAPIGREGETVESLTAELAKIGLELIAKSAPTSNH